MENQLIRLYLWVCRTYDNHPCLKEQRLSNNNQPVFTDQELITIYIFGHFEGHYKVKSIYQHIKKYWRGWFPRLPSYQTFNYRLNLLENALKILLSEAMKENLEKSGESSDKVVDSCPVILAVGSRSTKAKVAREIANKSYCSSKQLWYHGVKIHFLGSRRIKKLPAAEQISLSSASTHDLIEFKPMTEVIIDSTVFGDKAYLDSDTAESLKEQNSRLCVPDKSGKGAKKVDESYSLWSRFVSSMRQPVESLFNWIIQKTDIQRASTVRSEKGLLIHCYGKLTAAMLLMLFYY